LLHQLNKKGIFFCLNTKIRNFQAYQIMNMKQNVLAAILLPVLCVVIVFSLVMNYKTLNKNKIANATEKTLERMAFNPLRAKYMFDMVKDPATGKIPVGVLEKSYQQALAAPERSSLTTEANNTYLPAGNLVSGGRTRALAYDVRYNGTTNQVIIAGAVSGGIFRSSDGGNSWVKVNAASQLHNVHWIAQDPGVGRQDIWYAGGGEHWGNSADENGASFMADGIWRSADNGISWIKLTLNIPGIAGSATAVPERFDHAFDFVQKIAINPTNGHVFIGGHRRLIRSADFGSTWEVVLQGTVPSIALNGTVDVVVTGSGRVIAAINGANDDFNFRGIWTSTTGNSGSFTRIAGGSVLGVDSVDNWRGNSYDLITATIYSPKRIVLALAPSNNNILYVAYENGDAEFDLTDVDLFRADFSTSPITWSNRSSGIRDYGGSVGTFNTQGGYDLHISVKPDNPDFVLLGGVNLYRSTNGFLTSLNTTWIGGYGDENLNPFLYPGHHPDQHVVVFRPDNPNIALSGHDGGISVTNNITASTVAWQYSPNYQTFQYYYVAIDPGAGRNNFVGGLQDNGTWLRDRVGIMGTALNDSNRHTFLFPAFSGDGGAVGLATHNGSNQLIYGSSQLGTIRRALLPNINSSTLIRPSGLTSSGSGFGEFVTVFKLNPSNTEDLYYVNFHRLFKTASASTVSTTTWTELTGVGSVIDPAANPSNGRYIRAMAFSWGPYQTSHAMYIGTTDSRIFRIDDPRNATAATVPVNISIPGLPAGANIQDIAVNPNNDNEIMAVISNYEVSNVNVVSVWWTNNAKAATPTWRNAEGSLITSASVRSCAIVVKRDGSNNPETEYYIGTSVGLFSAVNIGPTLLSAGSVTWFREGSGVLGLPVVQSLAYRPVDNVLLVGTHGNGMFFTYLGTPNYNPNGATPVSNVIVNDKNFISTVFPTVSNNRVEFRIGNLYSIKRMNVQLYSSTGSLVYNNSTGYQNGSIELSKLSKGVYVVSITSDDGKYKHLQKIIRQ
jgi:hypothetical protein